MDESSTSSILVKLVGKEGAEAISSTFGGEIIYIPKKINVDRNTIIKREFCDLLSGGSTCMSCYRQLGQKYGLSPRGIMRIVNHAA